MDTVALKENFQNQLKEIDEKIEQIQGELLKAKEYKTKLLGGLETLELLSSQETLEPPIPDSYVPPVVEGTNGTTVTKKDGTTERVELVKGN